jgi:hypothetical protein
VIARVDVRGNLIEVLAGLPALDQPCIRELVVPGRQSGTIPVLFCAFHFRNISMDAKRVVQVIPVDGGRTGEYDITATDFAGRQLFRRNMTLPMVRLPRAVADSAIRELLNRSRPPEVARAVEQFVRGMPVPENYPSVTSVFVGRDGSIWIRGSGRGLEREWTLLDSLGSLRGRAVFPTSFQAFHAEGDRVWGTIRDSDDLPSVVRYRIQ